MSEIPYTEVVAELVSREEMVMYDDSCLNDIKKYSVEELYLKLNEALRKNCKCDSTDTTLLETSQPIFIYLAELYRRGVPWPELLDWWEYDVVRCQCPLYNCELSALLERVDHFTVTKIMTPDELRDQSGCCIRCHTTPLLSKEESKKVHDQTIASQIKEILHYVKTYVKMEHEKLRKIKKLQIESI